MLRMWTPLVGGLGSGVEAAYAFVPGPAFSMQRPAVARAFGNARAAVANEATLSMFEVECTGSSKSCATVCRNELKCPSLCVQVTVIELSRFDRI